MPECIKLIRGNPSRPPLVFLHGFLGCKEDWEEMIPHFEDNYRCIAIDVPGHGSSPYCEDILSALKAEILHLCSEKPILIGYSMGGRIALQLRACAEKLIILSGHPGLKAQKEKEERLKSDQMWSEKLLKIPFEEFFAQWYAQPVFQNLALTSLIHRRMSLKTAVGDGKVMQDFEPESVPLGDDIPHVVKASPNGTDSGSKDCVNLPSPTAVFRLKQNPQDLSRVLLQMSLSRQPHIDDFPCPTLFLYGEYDLKYRDLYSNLSETVSVRRVDKSSHAIHIDKPIDCAKKILSWLGE